METKENLKERLKHQVMERMDISRTMEDEEILELVQKTLEEDSHRMPMSISMRQNLIREIFHSLRRLDILQDLIEDADITEIMVNGTKGIFYEKAGRLYQWDKHFTSEEKLQDVIQQIAGVLCLLRTIFLETTYASCSGSTPASISNFVFLRIFGAFKASPSLSPTLPMKR